SQIATLLSHLVLAPSSSSSLPPSSRCPPFFSALLPPPPRPTLFPYTTLFRSAANPAERRAAPDSAPAAGGTGPGRVDPAVGALRSEEHTSELQSRRDLVCRLLLEKKKKTRDRDMRPLTGKHRA